MPRPINEVVNDLIDLYAERFGGKLQGRYKISKESLGRLAVRINIQIDGFIRPVQEQMLAQGYAFIPADAERNGYVVIRNTVFENFREVPLRLINQYLNNINDIDADE